MRLLRTLTVTGLVALSGAACADLEVTNLNAPDRERALSTANDVENLIAGSFQTFWGGLYIWNPGPALSTAADAHSASWGNFGMRDISEEPRKALDNNPSYNYSDLFEDPWGNLYAAISAASNGIEAIQSGTVEIGAGGANNQRALFFGKLVQGLSHMWLASLYDKAFIIDETVDLATVDASAFAAPADVWAAGLAKIDEALAIAQANSFSIPAEWVGYDQSWDQEYQIKYINGMKARLATYLPRNPTERDAMAHVPGGWNTVVQWAQDGFEEGELFQGFDDGDNWSWMVNKTYAGAFSGYYGWGRVDVRHIGPADAAGEFAAWLATPVAERDEIDIDTDDRRITGGTDTDGDGSLVDEDGTLYSYWGGSPFPASRGTYHFSKYAISEWDYFVLVGDNFIGPYPDLTHDELQYIIAEGLYRTGDQAGAMAIVNDSRANGELPAFANPTDDAPGGARCVPKPDGVNCGDLLEALKYEKRIDLHHYGPGTEFFDDRGWGDLVVGTPLEFPVPGSELEILLEDIYTWGGVGNPGGAPGIVTDVSGEGIKLQAEGLARYNKFMTLDGKRSIVVN